MQKPRREKQQKQSIAEISELYVQKTTTISWAFYTDSVIGFVVFKYDNGTKNVKGVPGVHSLEEHQGIQDFMMYSLERSLDFSSMTLIGLPSIENLQRPSVMYDS